jgi:hypothetical protein
VRRFEFAPAAAFNRTWCEVAAICGVDPRHMREDDQISVLCAEHGKAGLNLPIMELEALIMRETEGLPPPNSPPATVGEVVDYILAKHD